MGFWGWVILIAAVLLLGLAAYLLYKCRLKGCLIRCLLLLLIALLLLLILILTIECFTDIDLPGPLDEWVIGFLPGGILDGGGDGDGDRSYLNSVAVGGGHGNYVFAVTEDDVLWVYGRNKGDWMGTGESYTSEPLKLMDRVRAVWTTNWATLVLKNDRTLWAYPIGRALDYHVTDPVKVMDNVVRVVGSSYYWGAGWYAVTRNGQVWRLDTSNSLPFMIFPEEIPELNDITKADSARSRYNAAINGDGSLTWWAYLDNDVISEYRKVTDGVTSVAWLSVEDGFYNHYVYYVKEDHTLWQAEAIYNGGDPYLTEPSQVMNNIECVIPIMGAGKVYVVTRDGGLYGAGLFVTFGFPNAEPIPLTYIASGVYKATYAANQHYILQQDGTISGFGFNGTGLLSGALAGHVTGLETVSENYYGGVTMGGQRKFDGWLLTPYTPGSPWDNAVLIDHSNGSIIAFAKQDKTLWLKDGGGTPIKILDNVKLPRVAHKDIDEGGEKPQVSPSPDDIVSPGPVTAPPPPSPSPDVDPPVDPPVVSPSPSPSPSPGGPPPPSPPPPPEERPPSTVGRIVTQRGITLELDKETYAPGETIIATVLDLPRSMYDAGAFVAMYEKDAPHDAYWQYQYPQAGYDELYFTAPYEPGEFEMRLYSRGNVYTDETFVLGVVFAVAEEPAPDEPVQYDLRVTLDRDVYKSGDLMEVTVWNLPEEWYNEWAFVAIYERGAEHRAYGQYAYPQPYYDLLYLYAPFFDGEYELRLYRRDGEYTDETFVLSVPFIVNTYS